MTNKSAEKKAGNKKQGAKMLVMSAMLAMCFISLPCNIVSAY